MIEGMVTTRRRTRSWGAALGVAVGAALLGGAPLVGCGSSAGTPRTDGANAEAGSPSDAGHPDGSTDRNGDAGVCTQAFTAIAPTPPDILILMDRSGSMANIFSNGQSKLTVLAQAINTLVAATETKVNWGLKLYGDDDMCGVNAGAVVPVGPGNAAAVAAAVQVAPSGETPTETAVGSAVAYLHGLSDSNPKYLLLASGGQMNCAPGADPSADDSTGAESAVSTAHSAGYPTFVWGVVDPTSEVAATGTLNHMALVGGEPQQNTSTSFYTLSDLGALTASLTPISGPPSCVINVPGATGAVLSVSATTAGGSVAVSADSTNGWTADPTTQTITLNGSACLALQNGTDSGFSIRYDCGG